MVQYVREFFLVAVLAYCRGLSRADNLLGSR